VSARDESRPTIAHADAWIASFGTRGAALESFLDEYVNARGMTFTEARAAGREAKIVVLDALAMQLQVGRATCDRGLSCTGDGHGNCVCPAPTVKAIVGEWLRAHGYDGLATSNCGCALSDLMECDMASDNCVPGVWARHMTGDPDAECSGGDACRCIKAGRS